MEALPPYLHINLAVAVVAPLIIAILVLLFSRPDPVFSLMRRISCSDKVFTMLLVAATVASALLFSSLRIIVPIKGFADGYFFRALNVVHTGVFGNGDVPTAFAPPGYSFLLIPAIFLLGDSPWAFFITNLLLLISCSVFLRFVLLRIGLPRGSANIGSLFLVVYPNRLLSVCVPISDITFSLLYLVAFSLFLLFVSRTDRPRYLVMAGVAAGLSALVRGTGLLLFLPLLLGIAAIDGCLKIRIYRVMITCATFVVVLAPWTARNYRIFGKVIPVSTNGGYNLYIGNNPGTAVIWNGNADTMFTKRGDHRWNEAERDSFWTQEALGYIVREPARFIERGAMKILRVFASDTNVFSLALYDTNISNLPVVAWSVLYGINNFLYFLLFMGVFFIAFRRWKTLDASRWIFAGVTVCVLMLIVFFFGMTRFKAPLDTMSTVFLLYAVFKPAVTQRTT